MTKLLPIELAPKSGCYVLLWADSGYIGTPMRAVVGCWNWDKRRWDDHAGDAITDGGSPPTHFCELSEFNVSCVLADKIEQAGEE